MQNSFLNISFFGILKVNDENKRSGSADPDPLVRGMDARIRIRIHTKMSWIRSRSFISKISALNFKQIPRVDLNLVSGIEHGTKTRFLF
jgi:hypothetical protein